MTRSASRFASCWLAASLLAGCGLSPVEPWERADLAREEMAWDPDPQLAAYRRHAQFSKEGASGGAGVGGGGCGCN